MTIARKVLIGVVAALALLVASCSALVGVSLSSSLGSAEQVAVPGSDSWPTEEPATDPTEPMYPTEEPTTETPEPSPTDPASPTAEPLITDPPAAPDRTGVEPRVEDDSDGKACRTSDSRTLAGGYPAASCRFWKDANGLLTGDRIAKGSQWIACQRDLDVENPVYTAKQTNTWWMWTRSDAKAWDWFPATAIAEGASDQPIKGVALCE